jgi:hypothetical protein
MLVNNPKPAPLPCLVVCLKPDEQIKNEAWEKCLYRVPFVLRFKNRNFIVWTIGEGEVYAADGLVRGFRLGSPANVEVERADFEASGDGVAAAYVFEDWPPIPIDAEETLPSRSSEHALPIAGEFRPISTAAPSTD